VASVPSGAVWAAPFTDLVSGFDALMLVETIVALLLAIVLGTPGCEAGVWPELIGRRGEDAAASTKPLCVLGLHFIDEWGGSSLGGALEAPEKRINAVGSNQLRREDACRASANRTSRRS
jgi:hypothetical protein